MPSLILRHLTSTLARYAPTATQRDWWVAASLAVRDTDPRADDRDTGGAQLPELAQPVLFLDGVPDRPAFESNLLATGLTEAVRTALTSLGVNYEPSARRRSTWALETEASAGLRPASWIRSRRSIIPALGYGIHYEFGLFQQEIVNGSQVEHPDRWMLFGSPWEIIRADFTQEVKLYGRVE